MVAIDAFVLRVGSGRYYIFTPYYNAYAGELLLVVAASLLYSG